MGKLFNERFVDLARAALDLRGHGARMIFLRGCPPPAICAKLEERITPEGGGQWDRALAVTARSRDLVRGLSRTQGLRVSRRWSHPERGLDSVEFTKRLAPILVQKLGAKPAP